MKENTVTIKTTPTLREDRPSRLHRVCSRIIRRINKSGSRKTLQTDIISHMKLIAIRQALKTLLTEPDIPPTIKTLKLTLLIEITTIMRMTK